MTFPISRLLYLLAALALSLLLWPNPITVFMAACFSCLTLPLYRRLKQISGLWRQRLEARWSDSLQRRLLLAFYRHVPLGAYVVIILSSLLVPVAVLVLLVSPQAVAGLARLRELQANNFQIPPNWLEYIHAMRRNLAEYPTIEKAVNDAINNLNSLFSDAVSILVSRSFGFVGGTMTVLWTTFLFLALTLLFTIYSRRIRKACCRIFHISQDLLGRFIMSSHRALKAIMLGIVLVALAQGFLCGIGFAFAGVKQPAFWGMLATLVAPIPMVGTALVWAPLCISLWFSGKTVAAIGLALWGSLAVAGVDNVLRPFFLRQGINAPILVLVLAILCGLSAFGAVGLIAGPILLAFAMQSVEEANRYYRQ